jgi:hypothetical protein
MQKKYEFQKNNLPDFRIIELRFSFLFILRGSDYCPIDGHRVRKISFKVIRVNLNKLDRSCYSKLENGPFRTNKFLLEGIQM